jgi:hypothetical protein
MGHIWLKVKCFSPEKQKTPANSARVFESESGVSRRYLLEAGSEAFFGDFWFR